MGLADMGLADKAHTIAVSTFAWLQFGRLPAKAVISKKGIERVSFLPAFINHRAQLYIIAPDDPKFQASLMRAAFGINMHM